MQTEGQRQSGNVDDRRSHGGGASTGLFGAASSLTLVAVVIALVFGVDPRSLIDPAMSGRGGYRQTPQEVERGAFIAVVLAQTEDTWGAHFKAAGKIYREPKLVMYKDAVQSACGYAKSATGPFYCPADEQIYLDLSFFEDMNKLEAGGDFAMAYVIAHEVGHHVQTVLGITQRVDQAGAQFSEVQRNALSVKVELQADCLAGIWAYGAQRQSAVVEPGDLGEALRAAAAVGDDRLQRRFIGQVIPETFNHGSSAERVTWFKVGFESGDPNSCDTFGGVAVLAQSGSWP